jgi:hypothetical protein
VIKEIYEGLCGGHFSSKNTTHKILMEIYYWPKMYNESFTYVKKCESCQIFLGKMNYQIAFPVRPLQVEAPFYQWGIYLIGEI